MPLRCPKCVAAALIRNDFLRVRSSSGSGRGWLSRGKARKGPSEEGVIEESDTQPPWAPVLIPFGFWHGMEMSGKGTGMEAETVPTPGGKSQPFIFPLSLITLGGFGIPKIV